MVLVCQVTLQDHIIKDLYDFMIRSLSRYITILASLVATGTVIVEWVYKYELIKVSYHSAKFVAIATLIVEI